MWSIVHVTVLAQSRPAVTSTADFVVNFTTDLWFEYRLLAVITSC